MPIYLLVIVGNHEIAVEAKDGEINGRNNEQLQEQKFGELNLSLYHRWIQIFLSLHWFGHLALAI